MLFAFVAGAGTALSPCVLPVLPAVLSAGITGGRRRPLGVVVGLAASFTFATVALVYVIEALGLPDDFLRTLAIVTLLAVRDPAADPGAGGAGRGLRLALRPGPGARRRGRLRLGPGAGRQPRARLRALRRPDPGRGDHRLRRAGLHRRKARRRARLRGRLGAGALRPDGRRPAPGRPPLRLPRPDPDGDGRGDGRGRRGDDRQPRYLASRTRSPTTSPPFSSTRPAASRKAARWPTSWRRSAAVTGPRRPGPTEAAAGTAAAGPGPGPESWPRATGSTPPAASR